MRFRFEVTPEDIADSSKARQSPCGCPIARAICRSLEIDPVYGEIDVDKDGVFLPGVRDLKRASARLPKVARQFIDDFDAGRDVSPISFPLAIRNWVFA